jgi:hypothetical protein
LKRDGFRRVRTPLEAEAGRVPDARLEKPQAGLFMRMAVLGRVCDVCSLTIRYVGLVFDLFNGMEKSLRWWLQNVVASFATMTALK